MPATNRFRRHRVLTLLVVNLAGILAADLLGNVVGGIVLYRKFNRVGVPSPYYHHDLKPLFDGFDRDGVVVPRKTNSLGFADTSTRSVTLEKKSHRMIFIGDSFTYGIGVRFEDSFAGRIAQAVLDGPIEVLDAAVPSYSPKLYLLKIQHLLDRKGLAFDELWVYPDVSDFSDELLYEGYSPGQRPTDPFVSQEFSAVRFLKANLTSYRLVISAREAVRRWLGPEPALPELSSAYWARGGTPKPEGAERGSSLALAHMEQLAALCRSRGIRMSIAVYPWPETLRAHALDAPYRTLWLRFARARGIAVLDYFPAFFAATGCDRPEARACEAGIRTHYFAGDIHFNERGHQLIADEWLRRHQAGQ